MKIFSGLSEISISKLFQANYLFATKPSVDGLYIYLSILFGLEIIAAILLSIFKSKMNKIYFKLQNRIFNLLLTTGIIGLALIFGRFEQITIFSSRLILALLFLTFIIWGGWIAFYWIFEIPKEKLEAQRKHKFIKYLPQAAKRKIRGSTR